MIARVKNASSRVRVAALFLIVGLLAGPVGTHVYWALGGTWGLHQSTSTGIRVVAVVVIVLLVAAVLVVLARVGLWQQAFVSDRVIRFFAWALAGVFLVETLAAFTWSRGEPEWWLYGPISLVIALLALIVAGSGGAWPRVRGPHRTLPLHLGRQTVSTGAHPVPRRVSWRHRRVLWLLVGLVAAAGIVLGTLVGIDRAFFSGQAQFSWPPEPCVVQGIDARCGTFVVPENRAKPNGRTIGLNVVVLPASLTPARTDAVTWLAGGPGDAVTEEGFGQGWQSSALRTNRDFLFVDQRGTGRSNPHGGDVTQYGTRMAMDDLEAVRAALGYRQLDVIGSSYGATAAQVYLKLHPSSVRTLILTGGTAIDVPYFDRYAVNAQRAIDQLATLCASDPDCRKAFPGWERRFGELVKAWNAHPGPMTGDELASVVQFMLRDLTKAVSIPLVVSRAAEGDYAPLEQQDSRGLDADLNLMGASIWCNEPWTGLDAKGPWGTDFDTLTAAKIAALRKACSSVPKRAEPRSLWTLPVSSRVPVLALVGGADPQDPLTNLSDLKRHFPDSRTLVFPHIGHDFGVGGCVDPILADFVERGTTKGLDTTRCDGAVVVPPFELNE